MNNTIPFLKHSQISEKILFNTRIFLNLEIQEFIFLIAAIMVVFDVKNKTKTFTREDVLSMIKFLTSKDYSKKPNRQNDAMVKLIDKGYLIFIGNKQCSRVPISFYSLNKDKINYFLSTISVFTELEMEVLKSIPDSVPNEITNIARKDVLKHIEGLRSLFNYR
jgi:hypothetical protein